jgi:hypothetical protein
MRTTASLAVTTTSAIALAFMAASLTGAPTPSPSLSQSWAASPKDRRFVSAKHGIGVEAPNGWTLSLHTGYPSIVALLVHPNGSRISISVSETTAQTARELVDRNRRGLEAQRLTVTKVAESVRDGFAVDARAQVRDDQLRQIYLVRALPGGAHQAIILTLTARADVFATAAASLDLVVARLTLETPTSASADAGTDAPRRD